MTRRTNASQYFSGASPVLAVLAWLAALGIASAWTMIVLAHFDVSFASSGEWCAGALLMAFVAGISSFCPLGGISAGLSALTVLAVLWYGAGGGGG